MNKGIPLDEAYILARYMYRIGTPILSDASYDKIHDYYVEQGELTEYTSRTYDDDPVPSDLLDKHGYSILGLNTMTERDTSFLVEDKSKSIRKVDTMKQVFDFCRKFAGQEFVISIKMDGNNTKNEVDEGVLKLSLTRGRASNGIDVTDAMVRVVPSPLQMGGHRIVVGEVFIPLEKLEYVRKKYSMGKDIYKTPKSAAISFLRRPLNHDREDYGLLEFYAFTCDGLSDTVSGTYEGLKKAGLKVPPFMILSSVPQEFEEFSPWFTRIMDEMWEKQIQLGLPADGFVLELNNHLYETEVKHQYDERQIAGKFYKWSPSTYEGVISSIVVEQRRVFCCCKVTIDHVVTSDGCTATVINTFNPSFLINAGLGVGSTIEFERQSGTVNIMVNGKRMKIGGDSDDSEKGAGMCDH